MQITSAFALEIAPSTTVKSICRWRKSVRLGFGSDSEDILTAGAISIPRMLNPWVRKWTTKLNRGLSIRRRPNAIFAVKNVSFMEFMTAVTYCPSNGQRNQFFTQVKGTVVLCPVVIIVELACQLLSAPPGVSVLVP